MERIDEKLDAFLERFEKRLESFEERIEDRLASNEAERKELRDNFTKSQHAEDDLPGTISTAVSEKVSEVIGLVELLSKQIEASESAHKDDILYELQNISSRVENGYRALSQEIGSLVQDSNQDNYTKIIDNSKKFQETLNRHFQKDEMFLKAIAAVQLKLDTLEIRMRTSTPRVLPHIPTVQGRPVTASDAPPDLKSAQEEINRLNSELQETYTIRQAHELAQQTITRLEAEMNQEKLAREAYLARYRNLVQELANYKGNVRVMCRIKPESVPEDELITFTNLEGEQSFLPWSRLGVVTKDDNIRTETREFRFERVFGTGDDNQAIFNEVKDFALSATLGRSATIMGYGATGSGKSHTFLSDDGLVPSYLRFLFELADEESTHHRYIFRLSVVEIYLNRVSDLLSTAADEPLDFGASASAHVLNSQESAIELLGKAASIRQVAGTARNKTSSRSHFVVTIRITRRPVDPESPEKATGGVINFVDLAGSEPVGRNLKATGSGPRDQAQENIAAEGQDINSSLLELGQAVRNLSHKRNYFGKHNLARFLKPSLTVDSRVLVLVTVSSLLTNRGNTVSTLLWSQESVRDDNNAQSRRTAATAAATSTATAGKSSSRLPRTPSATAISRSTSAASTNAPGTPRSSATASSRRSTIMTPSTGVATSSWPSSRIPSSVVNTPASAASPSIAARRSTRSSTSDSRAPVVPRGNPSARTSGASSSSRATSAREQDQSRS